MFLYSKKRSFYVFAFVGFFVILQFQNCQQHNPESINTPNQMIEKIGFDHSYVDQNSCQSCHGTEKAQVKWTDSHRPTDGRDCSWCHTVNSGWKTGDFQLDGPGHKPKAKSCLACHEIDRATSTNAIESPIPALAHFKDTDCVNCHEPIYPQFKFIHTNAVGQTVPFCLPCHNLTGGVAHVANPEYFLEKGNCQTCHLNTSSWK